MHLSHSLLPLPLPLLKSLHLSLQRSYSLLRRLRSCLTPHSNSSLYTASTLSYNSSRYSLYFRFQLSHPSLKSNSLRSCRLLRGPQSLFNRSNCNNSSRRLHRNSLLQSTHLRSFCL